MKKLVFIACFFKIEFSTLKIIQICMRVMTLYSHFFTSTSFSKLWWNMNIILSKKIHVANCWKVCLWNFKHHFQEFNFTFAHFANFVRCFQGSATFSNVSIVRGIAVDGRSYVFIAFINYKPKVSLGGNAIITVTNHVNVQITSLFRVQVLRGIRTVEIRSRSLVHEELRFCYACKTWCCNHFNNNDRIVDY